MVVTRIGGVGAVEAPDVGGAGPVGRVQVTPGLVWVDCLDLGALRDAAVVLGKGRGFHVRLDGTPDLRVVQGAAIEGISEKEARRHLAAAYRTRDAYVRRLYRADAADPRHYHLIIDSTAITLDAVVDIILRALAGFPAPRSAAAASR